MGNGKSERSLFSCAIKSWMVTSAKQIGFVVTPSSIAHELVTWAVQRRDDSVLDIGAGEGIFIEEAIKKLRALGCPDAQIQQQVFGVEQNLDLHQAACRRIETAVQLTLPNFFHGDLFDTQFPSISVVVGNPPYVRRNTMHDIDHIRERVIHHNLFLARLPRLTDLYSYFLIYSSQFLRPGGRMAVIISSSWMDTDYGISLKEFLLRNFRIRMLAMCEARLFADALVKSVMLFAEKEAATESNLVRFVRLPEFIPGFSRMTDLELERVGSLCVVAQKNLDERQPWGIFMRQARAYFALPPEKCVPLGRLAKTRIGIQPLARDFYILDSERASRLGIPRKYLQPLLLSPKTVPTAVAEPGTSWSHYILFVKEVKERIRNKALQDYLDAAEKKLVSIRGKDEAVVGYHNLPRLMKAGRTPWYNLVDEIRRRGRYRILIPRRFYENFVVVWNKAHAVSNENFLEAEPKDEKNLLVVLGVLNTSFFELACRSCAQHYGGGVFNLNPHDIQAIPVLNVGLLDYQARKQIEAAYKAFTRHGNRNNLNSVVAGCFGVSDQELKEIDRAVEDLRRLSLAAKRVSTT